MQLDLLFHPEIVSATFNGPGVLPVLTTRQRGDLWDHNDGDAVLIRLFIPGAPQPRDLRFPRRPDRSWSMAPEQIEDLLDGVPEYVRGLVPDDSPTTDAVLQLFVRLRVPTGTIAQVQMLERDPAE